MAANEHSSPAGGGTTVADVVIVGAGPVGLMLACELGHAGIRATVIERELQLSAMPKGNGLVGAIATVVARRGLLRGVKGARAIPVPHFPFGPLRLRLNPIRLNPLRVLPIPQRRLEEALERRALDLGAVVHRGHILTAFHDDGERVAATIETAEGTYVRRAHTCWMRDTSWDATGHAASSGTTSTSASLEPRATRSRGSAE